MNFLRQLIFKSNTRKFKITKVNGDWVVMRDYSIIYVGSKELCKAYMASLPVVAQ